MPCGEFSAEVVSNAPFDVGVLLGTCVVLCWLCKSGFETTRNLCTGGVGGVVVVGPDNGKPVAIRIDR